MAVRISKSEAKRLGIVKKKVDRTILIPKATVIPSRLWLAHQLPRPLEELVFAPPRGWRFDFCWPGHWVNGFPSGGLALEVEGAVWKQGRHTRGSGFLKDMSKYNEAAIIGWRLIRCTPKEVKSGEVFELVRRALGL